MTASSAGHRFPAGHVVAAVLLATIAYFGAFYECVHRSTCVARQYYAIDWLGERYFLTDAIFAPGDWVDRSLRFGPSEWQKRFPFAESRRIGIALRAYHDIDTAISDGASVERNRKGSRLSDGERFAFQ